MGLNVGPQQWWLDRYGPPQRSLRFNSSDSAYLSRTPAYSSTNRKASTYAFWMKLDGKDSAGTQNSNTILSCYDGTGPYALYWSFRSGSNGRKLSMSLGGPSSFGVTFDPSFRDHSSWYHIAIVLDTDQATDSDRIRLYVNGNRITATSSAIWPTQGYQPTTFISGRNTNIGVDFTTSYANYFNGLLADVHFIDGQALDPTSFGEFDNNGIWQSIAYTGSYGTNGFHLPFNDNSTAAALGTDTSGNGNDWTVNNISVTAGAGNDSLVDVPTNGTETDTGVGGEVRGNYATLNPLVTTAISLTNGNLDQSGIQDKGFPSTIAFPDSGKWYFEVTTSTATRVSLGIMKESNLPANTATSGGVGIFASNARNTWEIYNNGTRTQNSLATPVSGDTIGVAYDTDANSVQFYRNGSSIGSAETPPSTTDRYFASVGGADAAAACGSATNFGQRPFAYTAPSGYKALCTANLPSTTITTSGSFTGNSSTDGPFIYLNGVPTAMTINSNSVTFGTHADKLSNGFKVRDSTSSYNQSGSNTYSITSTGDAFKNARAQINP